MLLKLYERNPDPRHINKIVELLENGGVIIYPTDTVYGMGCDITKARAVERVARIKGIKPEKARFSFICSDLSHLSDFARHVDNTTFKMMKSYLPGPYTFILNASNRVPKSIKQPSESAFPTTTSSWRSSGNWVIRFLPPHLKKMTKSWSITPIRK